MPCPHCSPQLFVLTVYVLNTHRLPIRRVFCAVIARSHRQRMRGGTRIASIESEALAFALQPPMILNFAADWLADGRHELGANRSR